jgi:hypothetical protein
MTTEGNFPPRQLCLKPSLYGRFSLDHLWPLLRDHQGLKRLIVVELKQGSFKADYKGYGALSSLAG